VEKRRGYPLILRPIVVDFILPQQLLTLACLILPRAGPENAEAGNLSAPDSHPQASPEGPKTGKEEEAQ